MSIWAGLSKLGFYVVIAGGLHRTKTRPRECHDLRVLERPRLCCFGAHLSIRALGHSPRDQAKHWDAVWWHTCFNLRIKLWPHYAVPL